MTEQQEFLEKALQHMVNRSPIPHKIVVAWIDQNDGVGFSYLNCNYSDLQHIGQEMINEGTMRLIAQNRPRMEELEAETESEDSD